MSTILLLLFNLLIFVDTFFKSMFKFFCFSVILISLNFTRNFLENALIEIPTNKPSLKQLSHTEDLYVIFPET